MPISPARSIPLLDYRPACPPQPLVDRARHALQTMQYHLAVDDLMPVLKAMGHATLYDLCAVMAGDDHPRSWEWRVRGALRRAEVRGLAHRVGGIISTQPKGGGRPKFIWAATGAAE